jgi:RNAse (barnase) inhibitor barstar
VERFDVAGWADEDAIYTELRDKLGVADYFGMNFDALANSLEDMNVAQDGGVVIALDNFTESRPDRHPGQGARARIPLVAAVGTLVRRPRPHGRS